MFSNTLVLLILAGVALWLRNSMGDLKQAVVLLAERLRQAEQELATLKRGAGPPTEDGTAEVPAGPMPDLGKVADAAASVPEVPSPPPAAPDAPLPSVPAVPAGAPPAASLEERLGTRWTVLVGGLAFAIGAILIARHSIEQGWFGPEVRIAMGALLAAALIGTGEWTRRHATNFGLNAVPSAHIPSVLTAAGTVAAFATAYAAHALYGFLGAGSAFVLLGAIGIGTMLAAALHGPALAGLGLVGALATPLLLNAESDSAWPVVMYLAVVALSAYLLARTRRWLWLAATTVAGIVVWSFILATTGFDGQPHLQWAVAVHALVQLLLGATFLAIEPHLAIADEDAPPDWVAAVALAALTMSAMVLLAAIGFSFTGWLPLTCALIAVLATTGWMSPRAAVAAVLAGLVAVVAILLWPAVPPPVLADTDFVPAWQPLPVPEGVASFLTWSFLLSGAAAAVAAARLYVGPRLPATTAALYALAATAPPLLALVLAYLRVTQFDASVRFAVFGTVLAAVYAFLAERFERSETPGASIATRTGSGALASAAIAAFAFALVVSLDRGYLTVAIAIAALGTAYLASLKDIPLLRWAVVALGAVVLGRVAWDPAIMGESVGTWPIFNWLLLGYGVPAAAFALAASVLRTRSDDFAARFMEALAVLFVGLLAFFQIRHFVHGGYPLAATSGHVEQGLMAFVALGLSLVMTRLHMRRASVVLDIASILFGGAAVMAAAVGLLLWQNPAFTGELVAGSVPFSSLLVAYLLPGLMALFVARQARFSRPTWYVTTAGVLAIVLIVTYATLEVRHAFQGEAIHLMRPTSDAEMWAYSVAWLLLGIAFLAYGIWRGSREARYASAALVTLATLKVFTYDLADVEGIWRALSFICLGAVLIGIGYVYQRVIFARPAAANRGT
jgi:uncharacterized membrane protein